MQLMTEDPPQSFLTFQEEPPIHGYATLATEVDLATTVTRKENGYFTQLPSIPVVVPVLGMYTELQRAEQKTLFVDYTHRNNVWWQKYITL